MYPQNESRKSNPSCLKLATISCTQDHRNTLASLKEPIVSNIICYILIINALFFNKIRITLT